MKSEEKGRPAARRNEARIVEQVFGCKWTLRVLGGIRRGVVRPGALERDIPGISTKVLNERLRKLVRFGVIERSAYPEVPPRVEYRLTSIGRRLARMLDDLDALEELLTAELDRVRTGLDDGLRMGVIGTARAAPAGPRGAGRGRRRAKRGTSPGSGAGRPGPD